MRASYPMDDGGSFVARLLLRAPVSGGSSSSQGACKTLAPTPRIKSCFLISVRRARQYSRYNMSTMVDMIEPLPDHHG